MLCCRVRASCRPQVSQLQEQLAKAQASIAARNTEVARLGARLSSGSGTDTASLARDQSAGGAYDTIILSLNKQVGARVCRTATQLGAIRPHPLLLCAPAATDRLTSCLLSSRTRSSSWPTSSGWQPAWRQQSAPGWQQRSSWR